MSNIINAKIVSTSITMADHGVLTFFVNVETNAFNCGIGGYQNGVGQLGAKTWKGNGSAIVAMMKIMDTVGVTRWEDLVGKYCRIDCTGVRGSASVKKIGNILEDKWFDLGEFFNNDIGQAIYFYEEHSDTYDYEDGKVHENSKEDSN